MKSTGHAKIIPDKTRHRCLRETYLRQMRETPLVFAFPETDEDLLDEATGNWLAVQSHTPPEARESWGSGDDFIERIEVNFLRHKASNYDVLRAIFKGMKLSQRGHRDVHTMLKADALDAIARRYPELGAQCRKQKDLHAKAIRRKIPSE